ncbi:MAG: twin-arginine translocation signal domain-containing protein, partial [Acidobacteriota bacterium]
MKNSKLDRRNFLKTTAVGAAGLSLIANSTADAAADPMLKLPESISTRRIIPLNHGWLYSEKTSPEATKPGFNDRAFTRVTIPHTNKLLPASSFDEQEYMFVSVYRRHFKLPKELKGQRIFV